MIEINMISKSYPGYPPVFEDFSVRFETGGLYCIMGESGLGKSTLLKLIAGLETPDAGTVTVSGKVSMDFQEDRLIEFLSPVKNIEITTGISDPELLSILDSDSLKKPCCELSGGQRRRVSLARAVLKSSDILLLDEPFSGLDDHTRKQCIEYVLRNLNGRTLIAATHNTEDARLLGAKVISLGGNR